MKIDVHLLDNSTGERRVYHDDLERPDTPEEARLTDFQWSDGNYGCDCNRGLFFAWAAGEDDPDRECGEERYTVEKIVIHGTDRVIYGDDLPAIDDVPSNPTR